MKTLTPHAIATLLKVKENILAEPKQFIMNAFYSHYLDYLHKEGPRPYVYERASGCGTAACFAGHILHVTMGCTMLNVTRLAVNDFSQMRDKDPAELAREALDLPSSWLFFTECWPTVYSNRWDEAKSHEERAQIAGEVIDFYIAHEGSADVARDGEIFNLNPD